MYAVLHKLREHWDWEGGSRSVGRGGEGEEDAAAEMLGSLAYVDIKNCPPVWPASYSRPSAVIFLPKRSVRTSIYFIFCLVRAKVEILPCLRELELSLGPGRSRTCCLKKHEVYCRSRSVGRSSSRTTEMNEQKVGGEKSKTSRETVQCPAGRAARERVRGHRHW